MLITRIALALTLALAAPPRPIETNEISIARPPSWLTASRVRKVTDRVQRTLEWDIRKVKVRWYADATAFAAAHGLGGGSGVAITAVSKKNENAIYLGPLVNASNFDGVFGHELAHIIMYQKYKDAVPKWLEEGLANYAARKEEVDYKWLHAQAPVAIRELGHPFKGGAGAKRHYMTSTAVMEMIRSKCRIADLLQLSVGEKLEAYLGTFCGIKDLDAEFRKFVKRKAGT